MGSSASRTASCSTVGRQSCRRGSGPTSGYWASVFAGDQRTASSMRSIQGSSCPGRAAHRAGWRLSPTATRVACCTSDRCQRPGSAPSSGPRGQPRQDRHPESHPLQARGQRAKGACLGAGDHARSPEAAHLEHGATHHGREPGGMHLRAITTFRNASGSPTGYPVRNRRPLKPRLPDAESTSGERSLSRDDPLDMGVPPTGPVWVVALVSAAVGWHGDGTRRAMRRAPDQCFPSQEPFQH